jgi:hypothetical protein
MTTGAEIIDTRYPVGGGVYAGKYSSVSWSGADRPKVIRAKEPPRYILRQFLNKKTGLSEVKKIRVMNGRSPRPPKRADMTPHPFAKGIYYWCDEKIPIVTNRGGSGNDPGDSYHSSNYYLYLHSFGIENISPDWTANDDIKLINKLKERINGSDFNLGIALAECHQTLQMIGDSAIRINKALTALKRGDLNGAAKWLLDGTGRSHRKQGGFDRTIRNRASRTFSQGKLSSNWLELQYGWLPLLSDVKAGAEWLANRLEVPFKQRYSAHRRTSKQVSQIPAWIGGPWVGPPAWATGRYAVDPPPLSTAYAEYRKQIIAIVSERPSVAVSLGLTDPLSIAWEKIPYSFVADWFIPIGDYLGARGFASSLTGTFVTTTKATSGRWVDGQGNFTTPRYIGEKSVTLNRTISTSLSVPLPAFKQLGSVASWQHCANAVALLTSKKW